ncbi:MAG TPA: hypothetical protein VF171_07265, partial [Trueperaceae bacterium]
VTNLGRLRRAGSRVFVAGLPPVAGDDFATAAAWTELLGVPVADTPWRQVRESPIQGAWLSSPPAARRWSYGGVSGWGRPAWPLKADGPGQIQVDGQTVGRIGKEVAYLQLLLEGLPGHVPALLREAGLEPSWERPAGALASRTLLDDGSLVIRACPSRYGGSFSGTFRTERGAVSVQSCRGFFGVRLDPAGRPSASYVPDADAWTCERGEVTT